jgi:hypothetical protein
MMNLPRKGAGLSWIVLVCTLIAGQSVFVGRFSTKSGAVFKTVYIAEGAHTCRAQKDNPTQLWSRLEHIATYR